jgi:hypothetical protein
MYKLIIKHDMSTWHMKVRVFRVPDCDTRITRNKFRFCMLLPKFPNKIQVSGISRSGSSIPGSGFGLRFFAQP